MGQNARTLDGTAVPPCDRNGVDSALGLDPICRTGALEVRPNRCPTAVAVFRLTSAQLNAARLAVPIRSMYRYAIHARRSRVVLDLQAVSWGKNVEIPPESDEDEDGSGDGEEGSAREDSDGSGRNDADASNLDALADGFVDDDFLNSDHGGDDDDDDDECCHGKNVRTTDQTEELSVLNHLEESPCESAVASTWTAARASHADEKVRASAQTTLPRTRREGLQAERVRKGEGIGSSDARDTSSITPYT